MRFRLNTTEPSCVPICAQYGTCMLASVLLWALLSASPVVAADQTVRGWILDSATGNPVPGATVRLIGTTLGCVSTKSGGFMFSKLVPATYELVVTLLGYEKFSTTVTVHRSDSVEITIRLQPQVIRTAEIVVSANKRLQAVQDVPLSIAVVDGQLVRERAATKLDEVLRYVPGVQVSQNQINIRGASGFAFGLGSRTTVLLDNFPLMSGDNGDVSFDAMPMFSVDRIEVVKGSGSALYGSSAIGGVVNVISREPTSEASTTLRAYTGLYTRTKYSSWNWSNKILRLQGADVGYSQSFGDYSILCTGGVRSDDSYLESDDSFRTNVFVKGVYSFSAYSRLTVFGQYAYEDRADFLHWRNIDFATRPLQTPNSPIRIFSAKLAVGAELKNVISENSFSVFRAGVFRTSYDNSAPITSSDYLASTANVYTSEGQFTASFNKRVSMTAGMSFNANDVTSAQTEGNKVQFIVSAYGQTEFSNLDDIIVTMGGRVDVEKTRGENKNLELSPKLGISYKASSSTNVRVNAGRSFRAPSVMERFASIRFAGFTVGHNPNLRPEKGWSFEAGAEQKLEIAGLPWSVDIALFQQELYQLIEPQFVVTRTVSQIQFVNITRARIQGTEVSARTWLVPNELGVETSLTAIIPSDLITEKTLKYRHNILWTSRVFYDWNALGFQCDYRFMSRQKEVDERLVNLGLVVNGDARVPVHVVDFRTILDFSKLSSTPLRLTLNVRNVLDYYYVESPGNLAPTRSLNLQVDASL